MTTEWIVCGVLRKEIEFLLQRNMIKGRVSVLDSILHMRPALLEKNLRDTFAESCNQRRVLVYGDCCPRMIDLITEFSIVRIDAINCAQMLLGKDAYRRHMRQESFLLLPEWTHRWQTIFREELGMETSEQAKIVLGDNRKALVYLDTGLEEIPEKTLKECSEFTGLPWKHEVINLKVFLQLLLEAEQKLGNF